MLLSILLKIIFFFIFIAAITFAIHVINDLDGNVTIIINQMEIVISILQAVILIVILVALLWAMQKLLGFFRAVWQFIYGDNAALNRYFNRRRQRYGFAALTESMIALAMQDGIKAIKKIKYAQKYLKIPEINDIIHAHATELTGNSEQAIASYKKLLPNERTHFIGIQGILKQKIAQKDMNIALKFAEKAVELQAKNPEPLKVLLNVQIQQSDWIGAEKTIKARIRAGHLSVDKGKRKHSMVLLARAQQQFESGERAEAKDNIFKANKLSPTTMAVAIFAAEIAMLDNKKRIASTMLKKAWRAHPHSDIATAFAKIIPDETPAARQKRFQSLFKLNPDHFETQLLNAELALFNQDFSLARKIMKYLVETHPSSRTLTIMAAIEKAEGKSNYIVRGWLNRALSVPYNAVWHCKECNNIHQSWVIKCENCLAFDSLEWKTWQQSQPISKRFIFTDNLLTDHLIETKEKAKINTIKKIESNVKPKIKPIDIKL